MPLLLHAVTTVDEARPLGAGLRGQPWVRLEKEGVAAWATQFAEAPEPFGRADLLEHHAIVSRLSGEHAGVLPARFPTWLADEEAIRKELEQRQRDFVEALKRVRGRVEIAVTAVWTAVQQDDALPPEAATPGRRYLLERQQAVTGSDRRRARARELADETERLVGDDLVDVRHKLCPSATVALSSAVLVPRENAEKIKNCLVRAEQDVRILLSGPWPPYTFADVV